MTAPQAAGPRVIVVMPAYNAARTLERTYADIPMEIVDRIILVDDVSRDETVDIARNLGLDVIVHRQNRGYGGNQKTCYDAALRAGADVVVMLHPDYQYDATRIPALVEPIANGDLDLMLGSRFLGDPLAGGMPKWKWVANRFLTTVENVTFGLRLSEYHTGLRAYSRRLLEAIPYHLNSDDFVFDQELIAQEPAAEHEVAMTAGDRRDQVGDAGRVVLVVGVEHHHDLGAGRERGVVAGLLVAAVALVLIVDVDLEPDPMGDLDGLVMGHVVDQDHVVHDAARDVRVRALEGPRGVVRGHDHDAPRVYRHGGRVAAHVWAPRGSSGTRAP